MGNITTYIDQYGYVVLFVALMLELIAFPLPGEVLMGYSGFLVFQGQLNWFFSILIAGLGSCIGISISYWLGFKLGIPFFKKYGQRFHMGPERIEKTSHWFNKHGNKFLIIAYFIPGVRHVTGYFSGISQLRFRTFALFAYSGAFLWVSVFITLGKILGPQWETFHHSVKKYLIIGSIIAVVILLAFYVYRKYKVNIKGAMIKILNFTLNIFHTRKRVGILLGITTILTSALTILMIGMIQDFLANEFYDFNSIVSILIPLIFNNGWTEVMIVFSIMGSSQVLAALILSTLLWILWTSRNKLIEITSLLIVVGGGELYEEGLREVFHKFPPHHHTIIEQLSYTFPSQQSLMTFVIYGYTVFIFLRNTRKTWAHTVVPIIALSILVFIAISRLFLEIQLPSDIAAGYVFGGVWLGLNILLLEIIRLLKGIDIQPYVKGN